MSIQIERVVTLSDLIIVWGEKRAASTLDDCKAVATRTNSALPG